MSLKSSTQTENEIHDEQQKMEELEFEIFQGKPYVPTPRPYVVDLASGREFAHIREGIEKVLASPDISPEPSTSGSDASKMSSIRRFITSNIDKEHAKYVSMVLGIIVLIIKAYS